MSLSAEDRYDFDVMGWLSVPGVLTHSQIELVCAGLAGPCDTVAATATKLAETAPLPLFLEEFMATFANIS